MSKSKEILDQQNKELIKAAQDKENKIVNNLIEAAAKKEKDMEQMRQITEMDIKVGERKGSKSSQDLNQMCQNWLNKYKQKNLDFNENENTFKVDQDAGRILLHFKDKQAEEDFVRDLAAQGVNGNVRNRGIVIANLKEGKLIDPRTNKEFQKGEYKALTEQLATGKAYKDIPLPRSNSEKSSNIEIDMKSPVNTTPSMNKISDALNRLPTLTEEKENNNEKTPEVKNLESYQI